MQDMVDVDTSYEFDLTNELISFASYAYMQYKQYVH